MEDKNESKEELNKNSSENASPSKNQNPGKMTEKDKKEFLEKIKNLKQAQDLIQKGHLPGFKKEFKFWKTQPVPQFNIDIKVDFGPIIKDNNIENVQKEPYTLPEGFEWKDVDLDASNDMDKLYEFLKSNYIGDESHLFGTDYSKDWLKWYLSPPEMDKEWLVSVVKEDKIKKKKKMIGFISAIPTKISINNTEIIMAKVDFLCVKKEFRNRRLTPVLIQEITRRINLKNIWQGVYKTFSFVPKSFTKSEYFYRSINLKKLLDAQYTYLPNAKISVGAAIKKYELPDEPKISGFRKMEEKDIEQIYNLISEKNQKYKVHEVLSKKDVEHWFLPRNNIVYTYVLEDEGNKITDFCSFYGIQRTILNNMNNNNISAKNKKLNFAFSLINCNNTISMKELLRSAIILAKQNNFDAYHCIDYKENSENFKELLFTEKIGKMKYYFYNFVYPDSPIDEVSFLFM